MFQNNSPSEREGGRERGGRERERERGREGERGEGGRERGRERERAGEREGGRERDISSLSLSLSLQTWLPRGSP